MTSPLQVLVDDYATADAAMKTAARERDNAKARLMSAFARRSDNVIAGTVVRATLVSSVRRTLDTKSVIADMGEEALSRYWRETAVQSIRLGV